MLISEPSTLTPKEAYQMEYEERIWDKQAEFNLEIKKLELEVAKIEAKWTSWLKLPSLIIKLPVFILLSFGFIISSVTKKEPPDKLWELLSK